MVNDAKRQYELKEMINGGVCAKLKPHGRA